MLRNIFLKCPRGSHSLLLGPGRSTWTQQLAGATNISLDHPTSRKKSTYIRAVKEGSLGCIKIDRPKALNAMDAGADGCIFKENDFQNCLRSSAWTFRDFIRLSYESCHHANASTSSSSAHHPYVDMCDRDGRGSSCSPQNICIPRRHCRHIGGRRA